MSLGPEMKGSRLLAGITVFLSALAWAAEGQAYRLVGIVSASDGNTMVLIESPNGKQNVFRLHDSLGDGTIVEITRHAARIRGPHGDTLLRLKGLPGGNGAMPGKRQEAPLKTVNRKPSRETQKALHRLLAQSRQGDEAGLIARLNDLLKLPKSAWIVAVDGRSTTSPEAGLKAVLEALEKGESPRLTMSGVPDLHEVRVIAEKPEQP